MWLLLLRTVTFKEGRAKGDVDTEGEIVKLRRSCVISAVTCKERTRLYDVSGKYLS